MLHNETLNIWTHLLGSLFYFVIIVIFICSYKFRNYIINFNKEIYDDVNYVFSVENKLSKFPIFVFLVSSLCCLGLSATYHTFPSMNKERDRFLQKFDFAGISILIFGSCLPVFYTSFYCNWVMFYIYISIIFIAWTFFQLSY